MKNIKLAFVIPAIILASTSQANDIAPKLNAMCEKVKSCALQNLEGQQIPPEMKAMMEAQFAQMCVPMQQQFAAVSLYPGLAAKAEACIDSKTALSCEQLMGDGDGDTPECEEYTNYTDKFTVEAGE